MQTIDPAPEEAVAVMQRHTEAGAAREGRAGLDSRSLPQLPLEPNPPIGSPRCRVDALRLHPHRLVQLRGSLVAVESVGVAGVWHPHRARFVV